VREGWGARRARSLSCKLLWVIWRKGIGHPLSLAKEICCQMIYGEDYANHSLCLSTSKE